MVHFFLSSLVVKCKVVGLSEHKVTGNEVVLALGELSFVNKNRQNFPFHA